MTNLVILMPDLCVTLSLLRMLQFLAAAQAAVALGKTFWAAEVEATAEAEATVEEEDVRHISNF